MRRRSGLAAIVLSLFLLVGCSLMFTQYVPSAPWQSQPRDPAGILVFYSPEQVPFAYAEIGRVFLKNVNYWADRDPGGQVDRIRQEAAAHGAHAVIIIYERRRESSAAFISNRGWATSASTSGDVYQLSGIAIVRGLPEDLARGDPRQATTSKGARGFLGIQTREIAPEEVKFYQLPSSRGVVIESVVPGSPAASAGMRPGHIVLEFAGAPIKGSDHLRQLVRQQAPGAEVSLKVLKASGDRETTLSIKLSSPPASE